MDDPTLAFLLVTFLWVLSIACTVTLKQRLFNLMAVSMTLISTYSALDFSMLGYIMWGYPRIWNLSAQCVQSTSGLCVLRKSIPNITSLAVYIGKI